MVQSQYGEELTVVMARYNGNGVNALYLKDMSGIPFAKISVNVEGHIPHGNCIIAKSYMENEEIYQSCLEQGLLLPTGETVEVGWEMCNVCDVNMDLVDEDMREVM